MSYPINYPIPQNANVQIFRANPDDFVNNPVATWIKPQGASFVWFTLIGAGGNGTSTVGGGSGAVTNFMCPAFLIPDSLQVAIGETSNGSSTRIIYQQKNGSGYEILTAFSASNGTAGNASASNNFTAMGFFQSTQGDTGSASNVNASATTFLSGGGEQTQNITSNYGYSVGSTGNRAGFFQMQPIIVGSGGMGSGKGGVGCGGGFISGASGAAGGPGMAVIITW
jgi:hypothetical protein